MKVVSLSIGIWVVVSSVFFASMLAIGQNKPPVGGPEGRPGVQVLLNTCGPQNHAHQIEDFRMAAVKVERVTACGFTYEDLEQHTLVVDPILTENELSFKLGKVQFEGKSFKLILAKDAPVPGKLGWLLYCQHCRVGCLLAYEEKKVK